MYEQSTFLWVEACCEVVESHLNDVLPNLLRIVGIIGESLHIGHKDEHLVEIAGILQLYATAEAANVVSQMELACWPVACEYNLSHCCL